MTNGAVWLQSRHGIRRIRRSKKQLTQGDTLHLYYDSEVQLQSAKPAILVSDEGDYSIWNKPGGMFSQGSKWGDHCTIYRWSEQHLLPARPAYLVHRLDRAANGLIILAHNKTTASAFAEMFRHHSIRKHYRTTVEGDLSAINPPYSIDLQLDGKPAETVIVQLGYNAQDQSTTLLVEIMTGRKHQIRKHLSSIGHPVIGDRLYGAKDTSKDLQLTSAYLGFVCPVNKSSREYSIPG